MKQPQTKLKNAEKEIKERNDKIELQVSVLEFERSKLIEDIQSEKKNKETVKENKFLKTELSNLNQVQDLFTKAKQLLEDEKEKKLRCFKL